MHFKSILVVLIISAVYLHESEGLALIKGKIAVAKTKLAIAKAPHLIATAVVAKEVKTKTKIAAVKTKAAAIAAKVALKSALTAPFKIFKTKLAIKLAGFKALKALKLAKIAKTVAILKNLKKSPIILPVPVPLPLPVLKGLPSLPSLPSFPNPFAAPATTPAPVQPNPIDGALTTATKAFQAASAGLPLISALQNTFGQQPAKEVVQEVTPAPVYRFVPEVGFTNYNKVSYQPRLEVEVPAPINYYSSYPVEPLFPVARYAQVAQVLPAQQLLPAAGVIQAAPFGAVPAEVYGPPAK